MCMIYDDYDARGCGNYGKGVISIGLAMGVETCFRYLLDIITIYIYVMYGGAAGCAASFISFFSVLLLLLLLRLHKGYVPFGAARNGKTKKRVCYHISNTLVNRR